MAVIKGRFFAPSHDANFTRPDWLVASFPLHQWIDVNQCSHIMLNEMLHAIANSSDNTSDTKPTHAIMLRRAHYVEWFSKRKFYDSQSIPIDDIKQISQIKQGLYFVNDTPIVMFTGDFKTPKRVLQ